MGARVANGNQGAAMEFKADPEGHGVGKEPAMFMGLQGAMGSNPSSVPPLSSYPSESLGAELGFAG